jgi:hypothetical protein
MAWFMALSVMLSMSFVRSRLGLIQTKLMKVMGMALVALGIKVAFSHR